LNNEVREPCGLGYAQLGRLSDEQAMLHLAAGHGDALAVLFDRYSRLVISISAKIVHDRAEAEDLTQEIFAELCRTSAQFDPAKGTAKMWIIRAAYRRSLTRRRKLNLQNAHVLSDMGELENVTSSHPSVMPTMTTQEAQRLARQMLGSLDAAQKCVIELVYFEGLSMRDVAERIGESYDNVRHRYYRGLRKMRALINDNREAIRAGEESLDVNS
jgi:RNA polymerase sigma-70 factor (ECF subfamily)